MQLCVIFIYEAETGTGDLIIYKNRGEHGTVGIKMYGEEIKVK